MCTIMTFNQEAFRLHSIEILKRIELDELCNPQGISLVIQRRTGFDQFNSFGNAAAIGTIDALLASEFVRFWLHTRMATTKHVGLNFTHGFRGPDHLTIMHNGILRSPTARRQTVDSFALTSLIRDFGETALKATLEASNETYANIFVINTNTGKYRVIRLQTGNLHTDGQGNYSTNPVATALTPVAQGTEFVHAIPEVKVWKGPDDSWLSKYDMAIRSDGADRWTGINDLFESRRSIRKQNKKKKRGIGSGW